MIAMGLGNNNLHITMQSSLPFVLCHCALLLVSFEGIVCPVLLDFVVKNFATADIYSNVICEGNNRTGRITFKKSTIDLADNGRKYVSGPMHVIQIRNILRHTLKQEGNDPKIVSFSLSGAFGDYNIKFRSAKQAFMFINFEALPLKPHFSVRWARIYLNTGPVIIAYEKFTTGDIGFKLLDNEDYTNEYERLKQLPYVFMRSDIRREIGRGLLPTLYLRNKTRVEDYEIKFQSLENLNTFLEFFPDKIYDEFTTRSYFIVPCTHEARSRDTSESRDTPESHDPSESHGSTSHKTSE